MEPLSLATLLQGLGGLKGLAGGGGSKSQSSSQVSSSVSVNPSIINAFGGGGVTSSPSGSAASSGTASPYMAGESSLPSYLPTGSYPYNSSLRTNQYGDLSASPTGTAAPAGDNTMMLLVLAGGAALVFFAMQGGK